MLIYTSKQKYECKYITLSKYHKVFFYLGSSNAQYIVTVHTCAVKFSLDFYIENSHRRFSQKSYFRNDCN